MCSSLKLPLTLSFKVLNSCTSKPDIWPSLCRMVVLETHQTEDQSGMSNLYVLEIAENYVMLPWPPCTTGRDGTAGLWFCVNVSSRIQSVSKEENRNVWGLSSLGLAVPQCFNFKQEGGSDGIVVLLPLSLSWRESTLIYVTLVCEIQNNPDCWEKNPKRTERGRRRSASFPVSSVTVLSISSRLQRLSAVEEKGLQHIAALLMLCVFGDLSLYVGVGSEMHTFYCCYTVIKLMNTRWGELYWSWRRGGGTNRLMKGDSTVN